MQTTYPILKSVHVGTAALSLCLFAIRGGWMMYSPARLALPWVKVLPHLVDTLLLGSAIGLAIVIGNYPGTHDWLTAKVVGLLLYIVLGSIALKRGRTRAVRIAAFFAALAVFAYIVAVAVTKSPAGPLVWIAY